MHTFSSESSKFNFPLSQKWEIKKYKYKYKHIVKYSAEIAKLFAPSFFLSATCRQNNSRTQSNQRKREWNTNKLRCRYSPILPSISIQYYTYFHSFEKQCCRHICIVFYLSLFCFAFGWHVMQFAKFISRSNRLSESAFAEDDFSTIFHVYRYYNIWLENLFAMCVRVYDIEKRKRTNSSGREIT